MGKQAQLVRIDSLILCGVNGKIINMDNKMILTVDAAADRLDKYLVSVTELSRSRVQNAIAGGEIKVNGESAKPGDKLKNGDVVSIAIEPPREAEVVPENIPIEIVYQDEWLAVINKPQGMVVHPAPGHADGTLVGALLWHIGDLSGIGGELRPGIVHRLDKDTSGLIVIAKNDEAHAALAAQMADKSARRIYHAIVHGGFSEDTLAIDKSIGRSRTDRKKMAIDRGGRHAVTHIRVLARFGEFTHVEASLETGRTHQIRLHLASIGRPVAGDTVYGPKTPRLHDKGQLLHAGTLIFRHPKTGEEMTFHAPLPDYFEKVLEKLRAKTM
jgi:23S rRNA pseudouridine1911/1915/1917 synthase